MNDLAWKPRTCLMHQHESLMGYCEHGLVFVDCEGMLHIFQECACLLVRNKSKRVMKQGEVAGWVMFGRRVKPLEGGAPAGVIMAISVEPDDLCWLAIKNTEDFMPSKVEDGT